MKKYLIEEIIGHARIILEKSVDPVTGSSGKPFLIGRSSIFKSCVYKSISQIARYFPESNLLSYV